MIAISRIARMAACSAALAACLAVPLAYASASDFDGDPSDLGTGVAYAQSYVDEDEDGYDDNTDEWIGYGTASALAAQAGEPASDGGSGGSASSGSPSAVANTSDSSSSSSSSSSSGSSDEKDDSKSDDKPDSKGDKEKGKDKEKTSSAFTFAGTGTTVDNATSDDGVEFFTIKTDDDKVYYLVVDRNAGSENVYLLNTVTGSDLQALAESGTINLGMPAVTQPKEEKQDAAAEQPDQQQGGVPEWLAYLLVVAVVGGGAFAYYRLKVKPEREESKVDEREVRSFEDDGIYPSEEFGQYDGSWQ